MKIVLASASPRRRELMKLITDNFTAVALDVDETLPENLELREINDTAEYLARLKAEKAYDMFPDDIVIGCDTIVVHKDKILGKPKDKEQAREYLHRLSISNHVVYTGCAIKYKDKSCWFTHGTDVFFNKLTDEEIEEYISTDEPYDKAGGYAIQGRGALFVNFISGDFYNVVGLPVSHLNAQLKRFINDYCKGAIKL